MRKSTYFARILAEIRGETSKPSIPTGAEPRAISGNAAGGEKVAQFKVRQLNTIGTSQQDTMPAGISVFRLNRVSTAALGVALLAFAGMAGCNSGSSSSNVEKTSTPAAMPAAAPAPLSDAEKKEMQTRDDFATKVATELHSKGGDFKNVKVYADNWTGTKPPAHAPLADIKTRTGDNLALVFWSPDPGSARGLADFTKSKSARDAVNEGFAEFQFVDPGNYCYSQVAPTTGAGPAVCGIRVK